MHREGAFGVLASETATPLAMVLTELLQNAVEHGYAGGEPPDPGAAPDAGEERIELVARRVGARLEVEVVDGGRGLPEGFDLDASTHLGLSIVRTLVESELGGRLAVGAGAHGRGTRAAIDVPLE